MIRHRMLVCGAALAITTEVQAQRGAPLGERASACVAWESVYGFLRPPERPGCVVVDSIVAERWRTVGADSAELASLRSSTVRIGGVRPLRAVLRRLEDRRSPPLVRLAAISAAVVYLARSDRCGSGLLDTLHAPEWNCMVMHPMNPVAFSIEPIFRDSIRARLRDAASEGGVVGRAAASFMSDSREPVPERWSEKRADWCRRSAAAFAPALRMNARVLASGEFGELARCTESGPPKVALAWQHVQDSGHTLMVFVRTTTIVRDRRLYSALFAIARDSNRPIAVRVASVDAIGALLHPSLHLITASDRRANPTMSCSVLVFDETVQEEGGDPMGLDSRRAGAMELAHLAGEDVPRPVADAARMLADCVRALLEIGPPDWR
jgi:hypothetical protein